MKQPPKQDGTFNLQWIEVSKLRPAKYNPRKDLQPGDPEYESLKKSINEFGLVDPIVVNKDMTVIGGHQRLKVIIAAGFDKVPCSVVDLDKPHEKLLNIALNKISGDWDLPTLRSLIIDLDDGSLDMSITGFNSHELELMMTAIHQENDPNAEWQGMPEFENDDKTAFKTILVHFNSLEDMNNFAEFIGQTVTEKTKSIYYPKKERGDLLSMVAHEQP